MTVTNVSVQPHNGPSGINGWLILPLIGLLFAPFHYLLRFSSHVITYLTNNIWVTMIELDVSKGQQIFISVTIVVYSLILLLTIVISTILIFHFFKKKRTLPKHIILYYIATAACKFIFGFAFVYISNLLYGVNHEERFEFAAVSMMSFIFTFIWANYFNESKRVYNTFIH